MIMWPKRWTDLTTCFMGIWISNYQTDSSVRNSTRQCWQFRAFRNKSPIVHQDIDFPTNASSQIVNGVGRLWGKLCFLCKRARIRQEVDVLMKDQALIRRAVQSMRRRCKLCILNEMVDTWKVLADKSATLFTRNNNNNVLPKKLYKFHKAKLIC